MLTLQGCPAPIAFDQGELAPTPTPGPADHINRAIELIGGPADHFYARAKMVGGDDPDDYLRGWDDAAPYVPTFAEECAELGRTIGLTGSTARFFDLFPSATADEAGTAGIAFTMALTSANREHARQVGYDLGVAGQPDEQPATVAARFEREFDAGWQAGADAWADRQQVMADWQAEADADQAQRWHDAEIAEAGGWYRAELTRGGAL